MVSKIPRLFLCLTRTHHTSVSQERITAPSPKHDGLTLTTDALSVSVTCACTDLPHREAMMSGTEISFATETESVAMSVQAASENVEFVMIESSARLKTVLLKSVHVMPEILSDTETTGVRVGLGVGIESRRMKQQIDLPAPGSNGSDGVGNEGVVVNGGRRR